MSNKAKTVFLDRDGIINQLVCRGGKFQAPYVLAELNLCVGVEEACLQLKKADFLLVIVTNQPDVARGWTSVESVHQINQRIRHLLPIDHIEICFHDDMALCNCRKPRPGMLLAAAEKLHIDLGQSFMVGDRFGDIAAGCEAGCRTILVGPGDNRGSFPSPDYQVESLLEAVDVILNKS